MTRVYPQWGFPGSSAGKEFSCNAGDLGLIPGLGRSLEKGKATHSSILTWRIPRTVKSMGLQRVNILVTFLKMNIVISVTDDKPNTSDSNISTLAILCLKNRSGS